MVHGSEVVGAEPLPFVNQVLTSLLEIKYRALDSRKHFREMRFRSHRLSLLSKDVRQFFVDVVDSAFRFRVGRDQDLAL